MVFQIKVPSSYLYPYILDRLNFLLRITKYATVSLTDSILIIGGSDNHRDQITKFENDSWEKVGNLQAGRSRPSIIYHNEKFMIFGGSGSSYKSEP